MCHLLQFILDVHLKLQDSFCILLRLDLLYHFGCFVVQASLEQTLRMVHLVLVDIGIELRQLVIHICRTCIILNIEVAVTEQREGCTVSRTELQLVVQDANDLGVLSISDECIDRLGVLTVGHGPKSATAMVVHMRY